MPTTCSAALVAFVLQLLLSAIVSRGIDALVHAGGLPKSFSASFFALEMPSAFLLRTGGLQC